MTKNYGGEQTEGWDEIQAQRKAKAINDNKIEVFFEDAPQVVIHLRELCLGTKIIQYGGRI